jgi:glycerol-3-phosphate O-acyltransferase 3/4
MQNHVLNSLKNCFFDRAESSDRSAAARRIRSHILDIENNRLLIFPEGTCVNNEYCVQFKQGAFDMDAEIVPIAMKYNKIFVDAFWNSRAQSFPMHLLTLMTSWAVVCDVWYLDIMERAQNETAIEFSNRVKAKISERAGLKNVNWDGYLKHFRPSSRYIAEKQSIFAQHLLSRISLADKAELEREAARIEKEQQKPSEMEEKQSHDMDEIDDNPQLKHRITAKKS